MGGVTETSTTPRGTQEGMANVAGLACPRGKNGHIDWNLFSWLYSVIGAIIEFKLIKLVEVKLILLYLVNSVYFSGEDIVVLCQKQNCGVESTKHNEGKI